MTDRPQQTTDKPSARMLKVLKDMAAERGITCEVPETTADARRQYRRLRALPRSHREEARRERDEIRAELAAGDACAVTDEELGGYGSEAAWSTTIEEDEAAARRSSPRGGTR